MTGDTHRLDIPQRTLSGFQRRVQRQGQEHGTGGPRVPREQARKNTPNDRIPHRSYTLYVADGGAGPGCRADGGRELGGRPGGPLGPRGRDLGRSHDAIKQNEESERSFVSRNTGGENTLARKSRRRVLRNAWERYLLCTSEHERRSASYRILRFFLLFIRDGSWAMTSMTLRCRQHRMPANKQQETGGIG